MFGEKLKKLRMEKHFTQEELAEKIWVTRTAISKWETNRGYPSIDSLKQLANLFDISIDALISDEDIENQKALEKKKSHKNYQYAMLCLAATVLFTVIAYFTSIPYLKIFSVLAMIGYVVFGLLTKPKYKRLEAKKLIVPYVVSRIIIFSVVILAAIMMIVKM